MRLNAFDITVAAAIVLIVRAAFAFPASSILFDQGNYDLGDRFPIINASFPTNLTDANIVFVEHCGDETRNVQRARNLARAAANVAKYDAARGVQSPFGFNAMFKSDRLIYQVSAYVNELYDTKGLRGLRPDTAHSTPPRLACAQPNSAAVYQRLQLGYDPWERCNRRRTHPAFYAVGTAYIFLCPDFHNQAIAPTGNHCPTVEDNVFVGDVHMFYRNYQMYTLMYELIRFYLQKNALDRRSVPKEVFDWNGCVGLSMRSSVKNPTNLLLFIALVQQSCLAAPNPFKPPFTPRSGSTPSAAEISNVAASTQLSISSGQMPAASVVPVVPLMLPLPYNETS